MTVLREPWSAVAPGLISGPHFCLILDLTGGKAFLVSPYGCILITKENARNKDREKREGKSFRDFYRISFHNGFGNQGLGKSWHLGFFGGRTHIEPTGFSKGLLSGDREGRSVKWGQG